MYKFIINHSFIFYGICFLFLDHKSNNQSLILELNKIIEIKKPNTTYKNYFSFYFLRNNIIQYDTKNINANQYANNTKTHIMALRTVASEKNSNSEELIEIIKAYEELKRHHLALADQFELQEKGQGNGLIGFAIGKEGAQQMNHMAENLSTTLQAISNTSNASTETINKLGKSINEMVQSLYLRPISWDVTLISLGIIASYFILKFKSNSPWKIASVLGIILITGLGIGYDAQVIIYLKTFFKAVYQYIEKLKKSNHTKTKYIANILFSWELLLLLSFVILSVYLSDYYNPEQKNLLLEELQNIADKLQTTIQESLQHTVTLINQKINVMNEKFDNINGIFQSRDNQICISMTELEPLNNQIKIFNEQVFLLQQNKLLNTLHISNDINDQNKLNNLNTLITNINILSKDLGLSTPPIEPFNIELFTIKEKMVRSIQQLHGINIEEEKQFIPHIKEQCKLIVHQNNLLTINLAKACTTEDSNNLVLSLSDINSIMVNEPEDILNKIVLIENDNNNNNTCIIELIEKATYNKKNKKINIMTSDIKAIYATDTVGLSKKINKKTISDYSYTNTNQLDDHNGIMIDTLILANQYVNTHLTHFVNSSKISLWKMNLLLNTIEILCLTIFLLNPHKTPQNKTKYTTLNMGMIYGICLLTLLCKYFFPDQNFLKEKFINIKKFILVLSIITVKDIIYLLLNQGQDSGAASKILESQISENDDSRILSANFKTIFNQHLKQEKKTYEEEQNAKTKVREKKNQSIEEQAKKISCKIHFTIDDKEYTIPWNTIADYLLYSHFIEAASLYLELETASKQDLAFSHAISINDPGIQKTMGDLKNAIQNNYESLQKIALWAECYSEQNSNADCDTETIKTLTAFCLHQNINCIPDIVNKPDTKNTLIRKYNDYINKHNNKETWDTIINNINYTKKINDITKTLKLSAIQQLILVGQTLLIEKLNKKYKLLEGSEDLPQDGIFALQELINEINNTPIITRDYLQGIITILSNFYSENKSDDNNTYQHLLDQYRNIKHHDQNSMKRYNELQNMYVENCLPEDNNPSQIKRIELIELDEAPKEHDRRDHFLNENSMEPAQPSFVKKLILWIRKPFKK
jgi:hypothetical protein